MISNKKPGSTSTKPPDPAEPPTEPPNNSKMKVTVCFGSVRVVVPCAKEDMLVSDLMTQAVVRYRRATGKPPSSWLSLHKLQSSDGGILDLEDKLTDVVDDREHITAIFEEEDDDGHMPSLMQHHQAGDGTSGGSSSVGTSSPDIFQQQQTPSTVPHKFQPFSHTDIEVTGEESNMTDGGMNLQVRRGSEPALNRLLAPNGNSQEGSTNKRWSAAPLFDDAECPLDADNAEPEPHPHSQGPPPDDVSNEPPPVYLRNSSNKSGHRGNNSNRFSRDCARLSMQFFGDGSSKWAEAAQNIGVSGGGGGRSDPTYFSDSGESYRSKSEEPRPGNVTKSSEPHPQRDVRSSEPRPPRDTTDGRHTTTTHVVTLPHSSGPLGIHLVPEHNERGRNQGLIVQNVEKGGRVDRSGGALKTKDKIIEINGNSLIGVPFQAAQELFRQSLQKGEGLRMTVVKRHDLDYDDKENGGNKMDDDDDVMVAAENRLSSKMATVASTRKSPTPTAAIHPTPLINRSTNVVSNTRKIGRKYEIDLQKSPQGLGFSITTRDNPAGGNCPIYVKNILPHGAAIDDGRLRPGDRLLEVNGIEITGKTQSEAVSILKNIPLGGIVKLVVSRQERVDTSPKLPRQITSLENTPLDPPSGGQKSILTFDIPVLDTEKAGLGISVKGKTEPTLDSSKGMIDVGIFIKTVIHGGAASRDGRVKPNDQMLSVNGVSLLNCSNTRAMEVLRRTMTDGDGPKPKPGYITLTVARRVPTNSAGNTDASGCGSSEGEEEFGGVGFLTSGASKGEASSPWGDKRDGGVNGSYSRGTPTGGGPPFSSPPNTHQPPPRPHHLPLESNRSGSGRRIDALRTRYEAQRPPLVDAPLDLPRNPVLDRLTGQQNARNESYYRATHDASFSPRTTTTTIMLDDNDTDYISAPVKPPRGRSATPERSRNAEGQGRRMEGRRHEMHDASQRVVVQSHPPAGVASPVSGDVTYASQTSLDDSNAGFSRDAFGRQSMSEKRHATLDAKSTDTYQRNKKQREERKMVVDNKMEDNSAARRDSLPTKRALRRGLKRPFSAGSSTEDDLDTLSASPSYSPCSKSPPPETSPTSRWSTDQQVQLNKGRPGDRLGLGDQLLQLLHHWGQKRSGTRQQDPLQTLPRVNSADSLVNHPHLKGQPHPHPLPPTQSPSRHGSTPKKTNNKNKDIGPSLGMKKSSSLESLQTMVQEVIVQEDVKHGHAPPRSGPQTVKVIRGRGCNESFRQAVDRSYEAPLDGQGVMETLAEEEDVPSEKCHYDDNEDEGDDKKLKGKKAGLFRGLGSMFRFGRHRKSGKKDNRHSSDYLEGGPPIDPVQEQYRRLAEKTNARGQYYSSGGGGSGGEREQQQNSRASGNHCSSGTTGGMSGGPRRTTGGTTSSLRLGSPRKSDQAADVNGNPATSSVASPHTRSASYDIYNEMTRPGSRVGFVDPKKYSHYINYDEIKQHLNLPSGRATTPTTSKTTPCSNNGLTPVQLLLMRNTVVEQRKKAVLESRRHQQHYHSQRRPTDHHHQRGERPVSNFYEYESIQQQMPQQHTHSVQQQQMSMQPVYGTNPNIMKQRGNNGITLPSPTVPLPAAAVTRQLSSSQFHAAQHQQQQMEYRQRGHQQLYHQNSLPRRQHQSHGQQDPATYQQNYPRGGSSIPSGSHSSLPYHHSQFPTSTTGRYTIGPSSSSQMSQPKLHYYNQNIQQYSADNNANNGQQHSSNSNGVSSVSIGSKV